MKRLTEPTIGSFKYELKDHKVVAGEFGNYDAFFDYSIAVKRLGELEDALEPKPLEEWHEDDGNCLWWALPIEEPPYCGTPDDEQFPTNVTHFTRLILPYWEDFCTRSFDKKMTTLDSDGKCMKFEEGESDWYEKPAEASDNGDERNQAGNKVNTYFEMNAKIVDILRIGDDPTGLYAAQRIEELQSLNRELVDALFRFQGVAIAASLATDPADGVELLNEHVDRSIPPMLAKVKEVLGDGN